MLPAIAFVLTLLYVALIGYFLFGIFRLRYSARTGYEPTVSIVVAARNEEAKIHRCLESLSQLDYPTEKLEIILVDDQSTDRTYEFMRSFALAHSHFRIVQVNEQIAHLRGKANALALGIDHSHGELVFLTDADCVVPRTWVKTFVQHYTEDIGLVAGFTLLDTRGWFGGMQLLDWAFLHSLAAGAVGNRRPLSCFGNNLTFRRQAYEEVGGFRKLPFSVTEDFALFTAITRRTAWKYNYLVGPDSLVFSTPCESLRELLHQKRRWAVGGLDLGLKGFLMLGLGFILTFLLVAGPILGLLSPINWQLWVPKIGADALLLSSALARLKRLEFMRHFLYFEIYYVIYILALPFLLAMGRTISWKGRKL